MLAGREDAEDAVQHAFLSAYRALTSSDKPIELRPWLFTIARNRCLSMLRARREQPGIEDLEPATEGLAAEVQRREDLRELLGDLRRLPDEQRAALVLAELGALDHDEIGQVLDCPKDKVKALVFQARSSLSASKQARETPCEEIREELATKRGGALRRSHLRRHLRDCSGCRDFRSEVDRQRKAMAVVLPVVPTAALKQGVLAGALGGAAGGVGGGGLLAGGLGALATKGAATKAIAVLAVAGAGTAGTVTAVEELQRPGGSSETRGAPTRVTVASAALTGGDLAAATVVPGAQRGNGAAPTTAPPGTPGSRGNRERAHELARSRGRGRQHGLDTQGLANTGGPGYSESAPGRNRAPGSTGGGGSAGGQGMGGGGGRPETLPEPAVPVAPSSGPPVTLPPQARAPRVPGS